jgi:hypothetical protein
MGCVWLGQGRLLLELPGGGTLILGYVIVLQVLGAQAVYIAVGVFLTFFKGLLY